MQSQSFAARAGRWSAQHRKKAILGWFAFVILATVLGGMAGNKTLADEDTGNGESKRGDQIIEAAGFPDQTGETVLVQGQDGLKVGDAEVHRRGRRRRDQARGRRRASSEVQNPLLPENEGNVSEDGRSVLVNFELPGDEDTASEAVEAPLAAVAALQKQHPEVVIGRVRRRVGREGDRRGVREGLPEGRVPLAPDHARDPAGRLRRARRRRAAAAARRHRRDGHDRPARADQPGLPARGELVERRPARRSRRRRRLQHVLPAPRDGGTRRRAHAGTRR